VFRVQVVGYLYKFRMRLDFLFISNNFDHLKPPTSYSRIIPIILRVIHLFTLYRRYPTRTRLIDGLELKEAGIARFRTLVVRFPEPYESIKVLSVAVVDENM